ncbi:hypothetical protein FB470_005203 [Amycolatopsis thermophila]|uniref:Uncharacterized protein n=1 Tax=Amycolatopsis thermophila TaxID=206084 RepID=A0ABU0F0W1_9PSEU|nr:hypothetical protein [Amycolatopsis thermophila]
MVRLAGGPSWAFLVRWCPATAGVVALAAAAALWARTRPGTGPAATTGSRGEGRWSRTSAMVTTLTVVGALVFTAISLASRDQIHVARQGQITDRYTRAVDSDRSGANLSGTRVGLTRCRRPRWWTPPCTGPA